MKTVDLIIKSATEFYNDLKEDKNGRYRSWEHCYKCFHDARSASTPDYDYLSLQLAFYLASWGMYRGSSFLLWKDYKVHVPVVKEILKEKYDCLFGIKCKKLRDEEIQNKLESLYKKLEKYYGKIRESIREEQIQNDLSSTLITKVLMGTLGCVPAYDRYFITGVKSRKVTTGNYNIASLLNLADFYERNEEAFEAVRKKIKVHGLPYPQMKMLDMGFWKVGFDMDRRNKNKKLH